MTSDTTHHCNKCGLCLTVCPVYKSLKQEHLSPRAKVQLIKGHDSNTLPSSPQLQQLVNTCLMCGSCTVNCPSGVDHYSRFMEMRRQMLKEHGEKIEIRGLIYLLAKEERLRLAAKAASLGQGLLPNALLHKFSLADIPASMLPKLNKKPFRKQLPESNQPTTEKRGTVLYFTGCATNLVFEDVGHASVKLLLSMGYEVIIPKKQTCCSLPMLFHGAEAKADKNIQTNIEAFSHEDVEAIIVDCPTCGSALKDHYPSVTEQYGLNKAQTDAMAAKVTDLMSFIYQRLDQLALPKIDNATKTTVTYHTPCHLKNSFVPADRVLREIEAINYQPTPDKLECCGGGGTFFYEYPEISEQITEKKIENVRQNGAELWLTDCPVCTITLSGRLGEEDTIKVMHPACFLADFI